MKEKKDCTRYQVKGLKKTIKERITESWRKNK